jgi:hypothetical protein
MSLHAAAEMLGDPARNKGRSSMDLERSNRASTTHGAAVYCHSGLVYGARVARGCPCNNVISQPACLSQALWTLWSTRGFGGIGRQARGPLIITIILTDCCVEEACPIGLAPSFILAHYYHHVESRHTCPTPVLLHHPSQASALHAVVSYL